MSPWTYGLLSVAFSIGCATARNEPNADAGPGADASRAIDAATATPGDAPTSGCAMPFSGTVARWDFAGELGSQKSTPSAASAPGVVADAVERSAALTAVSGASSINASNWPTMAALDTTKYFTFKVTPPAGCTLTLTMLTIDAKASSTGPTTGAVATSVDSFAQTRTISTATPGAATLSVAGATAPVELRVYGYSASGTAGTMRIQSTLSLTGTIQ